MSKLQEEVDGFAALLDEPVTEAQAIVMDQGPSEARAMDLKSMEDDLFLQSADILNGVLRFADINPEDATLPPQAWIDQYGEERAFKLLTCAKAGWMSKKEAPVGIAVAESIHRSITKARAGSVSQALSLNAVFITQNNYQYEEVEIGTDDE